MLLLIIRNIKKIKWQFLDQSLFCNGQRHPVNVTSAAICQTVVHRQDGHNSPKSLYHSSSVSGDGASFVLICILMV